MPLTYFDRNAIDLQTRIGHSNASVFKATVGGKAVAVKRIHCSKNEIPREVEVHSGLPPHPNVLSFLGISREDDTMLICMELADKSLYKYLHEEKKKPSFQQSMQLATQIARGMYHIHQHGLAHRDLKSANVLLFEDEGIAKVCDFGSARPLQHTTMVTGLAGTFRWMAPEFRDDASTKVNQLCDAFSYGMILYEIFAQEVPFADTSDGAAVTKKIREGERPPTPPGLPNSIKILMERCWEHESHGRPTFDRILQVGSLRSQQYSHKAERKAITIIIVL